MGWASLLLLGAAAFALLVALRLDRRLWSFAGAALMLGGAGYALQGSPGLPSRVATPRALVQPDDPELIALRDGMLGSYGADGAYQVAADAMMRVGDRHAAVQVLLGGLHAAPGSVLLWTGLGNAYVAHDLGQGAEPGAGGQVSPPALFAFQQAARLSPRHPAPPFFLGLAHVRVGEFAQARPLWVRALALAPEGASYRRDIAVRLALLDRYLGETGQR